MLNDVTKN